MKQLLNAIIQYYQSWSCSDADGATQAKTLLAGLHKLDEMREIRPSIPPVITQHLNTTLNAPTSPECQPIIAALREVATQLHWLPSPLDYISKPFSRQFSYTQLVGHPYRGIESAVFPSSRVALGFSLQAPRQFYPPHNHKAEEFYTPLTGTAVWQHGHNPPTKMAPGSKIFHLTDVPHAMETQSDPLLCLWAWIGDLNSPPEIPSRSWL